jgi:hypothetical protein
MAKEVDLAMVKAMMDKTIQQGGPAVEGDLFGMVLQVIVIPEDMRLLFRLKSLIVKLQCVCVFCHCPDKRLICTLWQFGLDFECDSNANTFLYR